MGVAAGAVVVIDRIWRAFLLRRLEGIRTNRKHHQEYFHHGQHPHCHQTHSSYRHHLAPLCCLIVFVSVMVLRPECLVLSRDISPTIPPRVVSGSLRVTRAHMVGNQSANGRSPSRKGRHVSMAKSRLKCESMSLIQKQSRGASTSQDLRHIP